MYMESSHSDPSRAIDNTSSPSRVEINFTEGSASPKPKDTMPDDIEAFGPLRWNEKETEQEPCYDIPVKALVIYIMLSILVS